MDIKLDNVGASGVPIQLGGNSFKVAKPGEAEQAFEYAESSVLRWQQPQIAPRFSMNIVGIKDNSKETTWIPGRTAPYRIASHVSAVDGNHIKFGGVLNTKRDGILDGGKWWVRRKVGNAQKIVSQGEIIRWYNNHITYYDLYPDAEYASVGVPVEDGVAFMSWKNYNNAGARIWPTLKLYTDTAVSEVVADSAMFYDIPTPVGGDGDATGAMTNLVPTPDGGDVDPALALPTITDVIFHGRYAEVRWTGGEPGSIVRLGHCWYDPAVVPAGLLGYMEVAPGHDIQVGDKIYVYREGEIEEGAVTHPRYPNANVGKSTFGRYGNALSSFTGDAVFDESDPNFLRCTFPDGGFRQLEMVCFGPQDGAWYYPMTKAESFNLRFKGALTGTGSVTIKSAGGNIKLNGDQGAVTFPLTSTLTEHGCTVDIQGPSDTVIYLKLEFDLDPGDVVDIAYCEIDIDRSGGEPLGIMPQKIDDLAIYAPGSLRDHRYAKDWGELEGPETLLAKPGTGTGWDAIYYLCKEVQDRVRSENPELSEYICAPWVQLNHDNSDEDIQGYLEHFYEPYDPEVDTPATKPYAYLRYAKGRQEPWATEFDGRIIFGTPSNEPWNFASNFHFIGSHPTEGYSTAEMTAMISNAQIETIMASGYVSAQDVADGKVVFEVAGRTLHSGVNTHKDLLKWLEHPVMITDNCYGPWAWESGGDSFALPGPENDYGVMQTYYDVFKNIGQKWDDLGMPEGYTFGVYEANHGVGNTAGPAAQSELQENWWTGKPAQVTLLAKFCEYIATGGQHVSYFCMADNYRWATRSPKSRGNGLHMGFSAFGFLNHLPEFGISKPQIMKDNPRVVGYGLRGGGNLALNMRIPGMGADVGNTTIESCRSSVRWLLPKSITSGTLYTAAGDWTTFTADNPGALDFSGTPVSVFDGSLVYELDPAQVAIFIPD